MGQIPAAESASSRRRWRWSAVPRNGCVAAGRQRYAQSPMRRRILDDLMVANFGSHLFVVVNAPARPRTSASARQPVGCVRDRAVGRSRADRAAGTKAVPCWQNSARKHPPCGSWMPVRTQSTASIVSFALGYTRRDGFEISVPANRRALARALLESSDRAADRARGARQPALEAGSVCTATTSTPRPRRRGRLEWSIQKSRRHGGRAPAVFGRDLILLQPRRRAAPRVGLNRKAARRCAKARRCSRTRPRPRDRPHHLWVDSRQRQRAGGDGYCRPRTPRRADWYSPNARPAIAAAGRGHALRSQHTRNARGFIMTDAVHLRPRMAPQSRSISATIGVTDYAQSQLAMCCSSNCRSRPQPEEGGSRRPWSNPSRRRPTSTRRFQRIAEVNDERPSRVSIQRGARPVF